MFWEAEFLLDSIVDSMIRDIEQEAVDQRVHTMKGKRTFMLLYRECEFDVTPH